jgi:hypothetical protein
MSILRERPKSVKGNDGWKYLDEADVRNRLDLGADLDSMDSKRVTSLDTAIC